MSKVRFRGQKQVIVMLTPAVYDKAGCFTSPSSCPIATAVREKFGKNTQVSVNTYRVRIWKDNKEYRYNILGSNVDEPYGIGPGQSGFIDYVRNRRITVPIVLEFDRVI